MPTTVTVPDIAVNITNTPLEVFFKTKEAPKPPMDLIEQKKSDRPNDPNFIKIGTIDYYIKEAKTYRITFAGGVVEPMYFFNNDENWIRMVKKGQFNYQDTDILHMQISSIISIQQVEKK
jgi:hypothetical protein